MRKMTMVFAVVQVAACGEAVSPSENGAAARAEDATAMPAPTLSEPDLLRVCTAGAAFRNGRSIEGIDAEKTEAQQVRLSYTRDDGKYFRYDCRVEGDVLRYRMIDEAGPGTGPGAWSGRGSRTTFKLNPNSVELTDDFFDGSSDTKVIEN